MDAPPLVPDRRQDRLEDARAAADEVLLLELQGLSLGDRAIEVRKELRRARAGEAVRDRPSREVGVQKADAGVERGVHGLEGHDAVFGDAENVDPVEEVREQAVDSVVGLLGDGPDRSVRTPAIGQRRAHARPFERLPEVAGCREDLQDSGAQQPGNDVGPALGHARHDRRAGLPELERADALEALVGGSAHPDQEEVPRSATKALPVGLAERVDVHEDGRLLPFVRGGTHEAARDAGRDARREELPGGRCALFGHRAERAPFQPYSVVPDPGPGKRCG